jgi:hypothetical protein
METRRESQGLEQGFAQEQMLKICREPFGPKQLGNPGGRLQSRAVSNKRPIAFAVLLRVVIYSSPTPDARGSSSSLAPA